MCDRETAPRGDTRIYEFHSLTQNGISVKSIIGLSLCAAAIISAGISATPAGANSSVTFPAGPRCPGQAPPGWEFVRTVQPPWGLPYDLYRRLQNDNTYEYRQIYC
jgi:hypothetical protein